MLRVAALHEDEPITSEEREVVLAEVRALADWLELLLELPGETVGQG